MSGNMVWHIFAYLAQELPSGGSCRNVEASYEVGPRKRIPRLNCISPSAWRRGIFVAVNLGLIQIAGGFTLCRGRDGCSQIMNAL